MDVACECERVGDVGAAEGPTVVCVSVWVAEICVWEGAAEGGGGNASWRAAWLRTSDGVASSINVGIIKTGIK